MTGKRLALWACVCLGMALTATASERLTSRPRPPAPEVKPLPVGEELRTATGQRRRAVLPDGSVLFVNQQTKLKVTGRRSVKLGAGEVVVDTAPGKERFVLVTPQREVRALGTTFAVRIGDAGTGVVVTRGKVEVTGPDEKLLTLNAGQRLDASGKTGTMPRASHLFDWTRELMIAAESPLVPASAHCGGAVTVIDPNGQETKLALRKYHVDVHIEDGFARTTIDQTYFNDTHSRLEGTFHFPLPADASLSRLAMYVDGQRMEGGMVERDYGRNVYERILSKQQDPALLEWVDGTTFKMRVFPLEPRQEKRILLSYVQKLEDHYGRQSYRFPAGHSLDRVRDGSLHVRLKGTKDPGWACSSHELRERRQGDDCILESSAKDVKLDRDLVLSLNSNEARGPARFSMMEQDGARYLMLRYRPDIVPPVQAVDRPRDWVFLFESSGDRDPLLARTQVEIIRGLLHQANPDDRFAVIAAGTRVRSPMKDLEPITPENVDKAIGFLEGAHLIGALDLEKALAAACEQLAEGREPHLVHVGSGIPAMGEQRQDTLVKRIPEKVTYVGVGVGRRWNRSLMKAAAERTGGHFTQVNPDEPISWRAFELASLLNSPRLLDVRADDSTGKNRYLTFAGLALHGEEVCAVTRLESKELPEKVTVRGRWQGRDVQFAVAVADVSKEAGYLPRAWAKLEIERLLAEDAGKNKKAIVDLSKAMYVMSPYTSLLVLENEAMYQQYKVDRGRKDHWASYECPEKIDVVTEDEDGKRIDRRKGAKPSIRYVLGTIPGGKESSGFVLAGLPSSVEMRVLQEHWRAHRVLDDAAIDPGMRTTLSTQWLEHLYDRKPGSNIQASAPQQDSNGGDGGVLRIFERAGRFRPEDRSIEDLPELGILTIRAYGNRLTTRDDLAGKVTVTPAPYAELLGRDAERNLTRLKIFADEAKALARQKERKDRASFNLPILSKVPYLDRLLRQEAEEDRRDATLPLLYSRPRYSGDERLFFDLIACAPGMSNDVADILAVLEAEADPEGNNRPGRIDAGARKLFTAARDAGWRVLIFPEDDGLQITFDGQGRYTYRRTLPPGIREEVVCDGEMLWHLYPDLHVGARRTVSRFHRLAFWQLVPVAVPNPEDLARGADLAMAGERTVAIIPHGAEQRKDSAGKPQSYARLHLVFGKDGQLAEQQVVEMPARKVLGRLVLGDDGSMRILDDKGKELHRIATRLPATPQPPGLKPTVKDLVVLPLPYRTREHVLTTRKLKDRRLDDIPFDDALALFAADYAARDGENLVKVFRESLHGREQRQIGLYVLLASAGHNLDAQNLDVLAEHRDEPLAQYLALHTSPVLRKHASQWAVGSVQWGDGFLRRLAVTHATLQRWQNANVLAGNPRRRAEALASAVEYAEKNANDHFGFVLLGLMTDRAVEAEGEKKDAKEVRQALARLWPLFLKTPGLESVARYEHARALLLAGQRDQARKGFLDLHTEARKGDGLLLIDEDFRRALFGDGKSPDEWNAVVRRTARELIEKKQRVAVFALALQCRQLDDEPLARDLVSVALAGIERKEKLALTVAAVRFLDPVDGERLLQPLLEDAEWSKRADLWRLAAELASKRDQPARELECLERALDAEYRDRPEVMSLETIDSEYGRLLEHYLSLAEAMTTLKVKPPEDFLPKVVRSADRWRALSRNSNRACETAARILRQLGEGELAWDYLTTPVGQRPGESAPWLHLAESLRKQNELGRADEAYTSAFAAEPTNAQILWDRAQNLKQGGRLTESRKLLRQLAEGDWQPRFQSLAAQARWQLDQR